MRHVLFIILLTAFLANTVEAEPNLDQTSDFIEATFERYVDSTDACLPDSEENIRKDVELFYNTLMVRFYCLSGGQRLILRYIVSLSEINEVILASGGGIVRLYMNRRLSSRDVEPITYELIIFDEEKQWDTDPLYGSSTGFLLGENNDKTIKVAKRLINALKHYSHLRNVVNDESLPNINIKFIDNSYTLLDGREFD